MSNHENTYLCLLKGSIVPLIFVLGATGLFASWKAKASTPSDGQIQSTPATPGEYKYLRQIYVDINSPSAKDTNAGRIDAPFKTIGGAMKQIKPGDDVIVRPGTYREAVVVPSRVWGSFKTRIRAEVPKSVLIKGSVAARGWKNEGGGVYSLPWNGAEPSQVYRAGAPLAQVAGTILGGYPLKAGHQYEKLHTSQGGIWPGRVAGNRSTMPSESFFYDSQTGHIYVKVTTALPLSEDLEISVARFVFKADNVLGLSIEGLNFEHSNTSYYWHNGAVLISGSSNTLRNIDVRRMDAACVQITGGSDNSLVDSSIHDCGQLGVKMDGKNYIVKNNAVYNNNIRGFNKWWEAGGMKFVGNGGLQNSEVTGNRVSGNMGDGIWLDWGNDGNLVRGNTVAHNSGFGVHIEASSRTRVSGNFIFNNNQRGIYLIHSRDNNIFNNLVAFNGLQGIVAIDENREDAKGLLDLRPRRNIFAGNLIAWNRDLALILPGSVYENRSNGNLIVSDASRPQFSMGWATMQSRRTLSAWRGTENQDLISVEQLITPPSGLLSSIASGQLSPDWAVLYNLTRTLALPSSLKLALGISELQTFPGPWQ